MQNFKRSTEDFNTFLKQTDKEETGPDRIPPKLAKLGANVIYSHLYNIINLDIENYLFTGTKPATVRPIYKKAQEIVKL